MSNETVTYSLEAVLKEIKDSIKEVSQKVDIIDDWLTKLEIGQAELRGELKGKKSTTPPQADGVWIRFCSQTCGFHCKFSNLAASGGEFNP